MTTALNEGSEPDRAIGHPANNDTTEAHLAIVSVLVQSAPPNAKLVVASFAEDPTTGKKLPPRILQFQVNQIHESVGGIERLGREPHRNVYMPLALFAANLKPGSKGSEKEVIAVLGLVADFDDANAANYMKRLPLPPDYVLETSPGRFQAFYLFEEPLSPEQAKPLATALVKYSGCDHGTGDISHIWRIAGTLNWPNRKKVEGGRPHKPLPVKVQEPWSGTFTDPEDLAKALPREIERRVQAPPAADNTDETDVEADFNTLPPSLQQVIQDGDAPGNRSETFHAVVAKLKSLGFDPERIEAILSRHPAGIAEKYQGRLRTEIDRSYGKVENVLDPTNPYGIAKEIVARRFTTNGYRRLHHYKGDFYVWTRTHHVSQSEDAVRKGVYDFLDIAFVLKDGKKVPFKPTQAKVTNVIDGLKAAAHLDDRIGAPSWLTPGSAPNGQYIACRNGLLEIGTRRLIPNDPRYFNLNALDYDFDKEAPPPARWSKFTADVWGDDPEALSAFQEVFGLLVSGDASLEKIFMLVGPKRSGKGTIAKVLRALLGPANVCGPTLSSLGTQFGMQTLIDKTAAIVGDARLPSNMDQKSLAERLLSISGRDYIDIDRKHRDHWTGQLGTRLVIMTNELPRFADMSGALASRIFPLVMTKSFFDKEDPNLASELLQELPGILNWALDGYDRLRMRGRLVLPTSSKGAMADIEDLASPINAFLRECCDLGAEYSVSSDDLYEAWQHWRQAGGNAHTSNKITFGRDLHAALPTLRKTQPRSGDQRDMRYEGLRLKPDFKKRLADF